MNAASGLELPEPIFVVRVVKTAGAIQTRGLGRHEAHELVYFVRGRYDVRVSGGPWHGEAGDAFCYPAGTPHEGRMALDGTNIHVVVQWRPQPGESWPTHTSRVHDRYGPLRTLLAWLEATPEQEREHRAALLHLLLCEYRAAGPGAGRRPRAGPGGQRLPLHAHQPQSTLCGPRHAGRRRRRDPQLPLRCIGAACDHRCLISCGQAAGQGV